MMMRCNYANVPDVILEFRDHAPSRTSLTLRDLKHKRQPHFPNEIVVEAQPKQRNQISTSLQLGSIKLTHLTAKELKSRI